MRPLANRPEAETGFISAVSWSPDGNRLLTSSSDHTLTLFDPATLRPLAAPLRLTADSVFGNFDATTGDIRGLIVVHGKQRFFTMPGSPDAWARMACRIAGTPLTKAEWRQYAGDLPYRAAC
jgi:WD40 repeat protein